MRFTGQYDFLSNFYYAPFWFHGKEYPSVEHAFQAAKCPEEAQRFAYAHVSDGTTLMPEYDTPSAAKAAGRKLKLRPDWEQVKIDIMAEAVFEKFTQHPELLERLKAVQGPIVEDNYWHDYFWGKHYGKGKNWLGTILMRLRTAALKAEITTADGFIASLPTH